MIHEFTLEWYIERFKVILQIRRLASDTIQTYSGCLKRFLIFCFSNQILPDELSDEVLRNWLAQTKSDSLLRQRIGTIQNFFEYVLGIPYKLAHIPTPKRQQKLPDYFTPYELQLIFNSIPNSKQRALVKLQYSCGLRVHEVIKVKVSDFIENFDNHSQKFVYDLKIKGKGGSERIIPVPDDTIQEIKNYRDSLSEKLKEYLFPGQFAEYYSKRSVQIIIKRAMRQCGIKKVGSTHLLRHSRATHLIQNGVDIKFVKDLLGHRNIKTTEIYTHLKTSDLRVVFNNADFLIQKSLNSPERQKQISAA